ncbi:alpha/beta fold hydrolase [Microlunatus speluncae]|uniref:alpha/beta fold hydrolase n=1 Tax=Microlunatus speluncae TaxID=2594267 RepID=UPI0012667431|nr:alpha/beta fold hydrolase [Microlunatus speluncae]
MTTIYRTEGGARRLEQQYRAVLDAWPVEAEHRLVPTREGDTFVSVSGPAEAPPVVLLHGSGANATTWRGDLAAWSAEFRTHAVDLVGEPGLSARSRPVLDSPAPAAWLDDVLDELGLDHAALVAMSLGGWHALDYAIRRPARVDRLALLCPGGIGRQTYGWLPAAMLLRLFGPWGVRRTAGLVTGLDRQTLGPVLDSIVDTFAEFRPRTERLPVFGDQALGGLAMPTMIIVGDRDVMYDSAETARRAEALLPNSSVTVLPGVGHAVLGQTEQVLEFLRSR